MVWNKHKPVPWEVMPATPSVVSTTTTMAILDTPAPGTPELVQPPDDAGAEDISAALGSGGLPPWLNEELL